MKNKSLKIAIGVVLTIGIVWFFAWKFAHVTGPIHLLMHILGKLHLI